MKTSFEQLMKEAQNIQLDHREKAFVRGELIMFMRKHPIPAKTHFAWFLLFTRRSIIAFGIVTLVSGGISYAAEGSLPGDTLYPIKIHVNERVVTWSALSSHKEAEWQSRVVERRIEEAETLASEGILDATLLAQLEARIDAETEKVAQQIDTFEARSDLETAAVVSSNFESALRAHEKILLNLSAPPSATSTRTSLAEAKSEQSSIVENIKKKRDRIATKRDTIESRITTSAEKAAAAKRKSAEEKAAKVKNLISSLSLSLGKEVSEEAKTRLEMGEKTIREGNEKLDAQSSANAFRLYQKAERSLEEARLLLEAHRKFNIRPYFNGEQDKQENERNHGDKTSEDEDISEEDKDSENDKGDNT